MIADLLIMLAVGVVFILPLIVWALILARRGDADRITCADLTNPLPFRRDEEKR